eukprot:98238_1
MVPLAEWIAIICVVYIEHLLKCLSTKYIQDSGYWRSTWQSTSDIIPKQSTSYGTIRLGKIMSIEFDFLFNGRSNDVVSCEQMDPSVHGGIRTREFQENFFRIGKKSMATPPDCYASHFPTIWQCPLTVHITQNPRNLS